MRDVPNPLAFVTAVARLTSVKPNIGAFAMNGVVVRGNHFWRLVILNKC